MIPLPALPLPRVFKAFDPANAKAFAMILGPALLIQWLLPWAGGKAWSWSSGILSGSLFSLIAGIGLTVLAYAPLAGVKRGHIFAATAGAGLVGVLWTGAAMGGTYFFLSLFGTLGLSLTVATLSLWVRNGHKPLYTNLLWGGLVLLALGLLLPIGGGGGIPLVEMFSVLGQKMFNIVGRIFFMLLSLGFLFILVLLEMNVVLKGDKADRDQVERTALVLFWYPWPALFIFGLFTFFFGFGPSMHLIVIMGSFVFLSTFGLVAFFEHTGRGEGVATLINAD
jgi:hypothetical protein